MGYSLDTERCGILAIHSRLPTFQLSSVITVLVCAIYVGYCCKYKLLAVTIALYKSGEQVAKVGWGGGAQTVDCVL